jgi:hypothetical protein
VKNPPRVRLTLHGDQFYLDPLQPGEQVLNVIALDELGAGRARRIGCLVVPVEAVPQLGALGVLVGLGVLAHLEIVGDGAPPVYHLSPREARLLKIAAKVLG